MRQTSTRCRRAKIHFWQTRRNLLSASFGLGTKRQKRISVAQGESCSQQVSKSFDKKGFVSLLLSAKSFRKTSPHEKTSIEKILLLFYIRAIDLCDYLSIIKIEMCESNLASNIEMCVSLRRDPAEKCGGALCYIEKSNRILRTI